MPLDRSSLPPSPLLPSPTSLVAIITNRYKPHEVEAESAFKKATIVAYYHTQVG